jgi:hypothetical protein
MPCTGNEVPVGTDAYVAAEQQRRTFATYIDRTPVAPTCSALTNFLLFDLRVDLGVIDLTRQLFNGRRFCGHFGRFGYDRCHFNRQRFCG